MKPNATPRTLAECQFVTGYSSAETRRADRPYRWAVLLACIVIGATFAIGV